MGKLSWQARVKLKGEDGMKAFMKKLRSEQLEAKNKTK